MKDGFDDALRRVLVHEGGYVNDPDDPGGETNKGVTQAVYAVYRQRMNRPVQSVRLMSDAEMKDIYRAQFATKIRFDDLPAGLDYAVFDAAVNSGPGQAIKWLQRAAGVKADGDFGMVTLKAVSDSSDIDLLVQAFCDRRRAFIRALRTYKKFGKGWERRINEVQTAAQAAATGSVGPDPTAAAPYRAWSVSAMKPPSTAIADAAVGTGGATAVISQVTSGLAPVASSSATINTVVMCLTVAGVLISAGAYAYRSWASKKSAELADALDLHVTPAPEPANDNTDAPTPPAAPAAKEAA